MFLELSARGLYGALKVILFCAFSVRQPTKNVGNKCHGHLSLLAKVSDHDSCFSYLCPPQSRVFTELSAWGLLCVWACARSRARRKSAGNAVFIGLRCVRFWKSDGATTVAPIFPLWWRYAAAGLHRVALTNHRGQKNPIARLWLPQSRERYDCDICRVNFCRSI